MPARPSIRWRQAAAPALVPEMAQAVETAGAAETALPLAETPAPEEVPMDALEPHSLPSDETGPEPEVADAPEMIDTTVDAAPAAGSTVEADEQAVQASAADEPADAPPTDDEVVVAEPSPELGVRPGRRERGSCAGPREADRVPGQPDAGDAGRRRGAAGRHPEPLPRRRRHGRRGDPGPDRRPGGDAAHDGGHRRRRHQGVVQGRDRPDPGGDRAADQRPPAPAGRPGRAARGAHGRRGRQGRRAGRAVRARDGCLLRGPP